MNVIARLNALYASEIVAAQQYWRHANDVTGIYSSQLQGVFEEHANEEMGHAAILRNQIHILNGSLDNELSEMVLNNPSSGAKDVQYSGLATEMLKQDLIAENDAIKNYTELANEVRDLYPGLYVELCKILNDELHHAQELSNLLGI